MSVATRHTCVGTNGGQYTGGATRVMNTPPRVRYGNQSGPLALCAPTKLSARIPAGVPRKGSLTSIDNAKSPINKRVERLG
jgi:hypothetical protein